VRLIDISQGWYLGMPSFEATWYPKFDIERVMTPTTDPAGRNRTFTRLSLFPHNGSHVESGFHFDPEGRPIDEVPLGTFLGPAVVADLSHKSDREAVSADDLDQAVSEVWKPGLRLLIRTDHPLRNLGATHYWDVAPYLTPQAADWMVDHEVALCGMDCVTERQGERDFPVHRRLLGAGIPILENIANLHQISHRRVWLTALPIKVADVEAVPVRAVVIEDWTP
jgi:arylformamidase